MFNWYKFNKTELAILNSVQGALSPDAADLFAAQLAAINYIRRWDEQRDVNCWTLRWGKSYHDPAINFPYQVREAKLATVTFKAPGDEKARKAVLWIVLGRFFCINFTQTPKGIRSADAFTILKVAVHCDPMEARADELLAEEGPVVVTGWLVEWSKAYKITHTVPPMDARTVQQIIDGFSAPLPADYLEIVSQSEGFRLNDVAVCGIAEAYNINIDGEPYRVLAAVGGEGVLAVGETLATGSVFYLHYDGEPAVNLGLSFRTAVETMLGRTEAVD